MEFQAQIAGAEMKPKSSQTKQKQANTDGETLADRLRRRQQEKRDKEGASGKAQFSQGVGYRVIGG